MVLSFTLSAAVATRVETAVCAVYQYQPLINGVANPESSAAFTKRKIADVIKGIVVQYERQKNHQAAIDALAPVTDPVVT